MEQKENTLDIRNMPDVQKRLIFGEPVRNESSNAKSKRVNAFNSLAEPQKNFEVENEGTDLMGGAMNKKKDCFLQRFVISVNNTYKSIWDIFILFLIGYSCITSAYYVAFGLPTTQALLNFEIFVEVCFGVDILLRFLHEYRDPESFEYIRDIKQIAKNYLMSWFIVDFVAIIPFNWIVSSDTTWIKLVRILRLPKFMRILDQSKFDQLLESILENTNRQKKMNYLYASKYVYKVIRLIIIATTLTYFMGCLWFFVASNQYINPGPVTFYTKYNLNYYSDQRNLVICCYFALTTLATVGYGDFTPQSNIEKIVGILIMILGIALFSYIMGNFNDVLTNYDKQMGIVDKGSDLQAWMISLSKFTGNQPLPRDLVQKIDEHFKFFWKNDRLSSLTLDDKYLNLMPKPLRYQLIKYLFDDIFQMFRGFLMTKEFPDSPFYYEIAFEFLPRKYNPGEIIVQQGDIVHEIYMIMEGSMHVYFEWEGIKIGRNFGLGFCFGNFNVFTDNLSEFTFQAVKAGGNIQSTKIFAIPKQKILKILKGYPDIYSKMVANSRKNIKSLRDTLMYELKNQIRKVKGEAPDSAELQRIFKECVSDKVKVAPVIPASLRSSIGPEKASDIEKKLESTQIGLDSLMNEIDAFSKTVGGELDEITSRLEQLRDHLTARDKNK